MFKWPPSQSHGGMKLLDIFLLSSRTAPSAISSAVMYGKEISGCGISRNLECLSKVDQGARHLNATWVPFWNLGQGWLCHESGSNCAFHVARTKRSLLHRPVYLFKDFFSLNFQTQLMVVQGCHRFALSPQPAPCLLSSRRIPRKVFCVFPANSFQSVSDNGALGQVTEHLARKV